MPGEVPFYVTGTVTEVSVLYHLAYVKVDNGNVYHLYPETPGIDFMKLKRGQFVELEVTSMLTRVLSGIIIEQ